MKRLIIAAAIAVVATTMSGCGGNDDPTPTTPTPTPTPCQLALTDTEPSPTGCVWNDEARKAYFLTYSDKVSDLSHEQAISLASDTCEALAAGRSFEQAVAQNSQGQYGDDVNAITSVMQSGVWQFCKGHIEGVDKYLQAHPLQQVPGSYPDPVPTDGDTDCQEECLGGG